MAFSNTIAAWCDSNSHVKPVVHVNVLFIIITNLISCHGIRLLLLLGLVALHRLESLSLAHNFLSTEAINTQNSPLKALSALKRLDLSYNLLRTIPDAILTLTT